MPRVGWVKPRDDQRLSDHVAFGVLTRSFPPGLVDAVVAACGRGEQRSRLLPARLVVYYVMALALFSGSGYEEVMRSLVEGLAWESGWSQRWTVPSQPALSQARARLGVEPLAELFRRGCVALASESTPGGFWRGRRLMSIDGTILDLADTTDNATEFGRPGSSRGEGSAFPQLRLVGLGECATHVVVGAAMGSCTTGEITLARGLLGSMNAGMVVPLMVCQHVFLAIAAPISWKAVLDVLDELRAVAGQQDLHGREALVDEHRLPDAIAMLVVDGIDSIVEDQHG